MNDLMTRQKKRKLEADRNVDGRSGLGAFVDLLDSEKCDKNERLNIRFSAYGYVNVYTYQQHKLLHKHQLFSLEER